ncbi:MAG: glutamine-hydrolyzing GMP synthase [Hyphomicrobium sp.]|nr:glutamine-hydrolyzing GMP synthase [Hyphomicrobium sp.]
MPSSDATPVVPNEPLGDVVLIIDFGSQVTQLIARRVREAGVYSEIVPFNRAEEALRRLAPKAIILSGGPASVTTAGSPRAPQGVFEAGVPVLSICYGQQATAVQLGGVVEGGHAAEFGRADIEIREKSALFEGIWEIGKRYPVWMSHGDRVTRLPDGFTVKAVSENAPFAIATDERRRIYTTMFHPEVVHTPDGARLIAHEWLKVRHAIADRGLLDGLELRNLCFIRCNEKLGNALVGDAVLVAELVELRLAIDAQLGAQRARRIIDARVNDLAVARAGLGADDVVLLEDHHLAPGHGECACNGEADDAGADDNRFNISSHWVSWFLGS